MNSAVDRLRRRRLLGTFFGLWQDDHVQMKVEKAVANHSREKDAQLDQVSMRFNKEIDSLATRLNQTQAALDEANRDRVNMQDNLKKAFMRGVCALNFEAMSILAPKGGAGGDAPMIVGETASLADRVQQMGSIFASQPQSQPPRNERTPSPGEDIAPRSYVGQKETEPSQPYGMNTSPGKQIIFFNESVAESKNHKWKAAPILGGTYEEVLPRKKIEIQRESPPSRTKQIPADEKKKLIDDVMGKENDDDNIKPKIPSNLNKPKVDPKDEGKVIRPSPRKSASKPPTSCLLYTSPSPRDS
eukprot:TRINITY_DN2952_c0_g1_i3.p1 TRINITY_DN2952_c0_g1~~TRINITY_DN2952_c0_g1_i3.p1  ORF type:complete len:301 (+),score=94.57 TRINITY_DN2952_c0_g1_i3:698-1600(+)